MSVCVCVCVCVGVCACVGVGGWVGVRGGGCGREWEWERGGTSEAGSIRDGSREVGARAQQGMRPAL